MQQATPAAEPIFWPNPAQTCAKRGRTAALRTMVTKTAHRVSPLLLSALRVASILLLVSGLANLLTNGHEFLVNCDGNTHGGGLLMMSASKKDEGQDCEGKVHPVFCFDRARNSTLPTAIVAGLVGATSCEAS